MSDPVESPAAGTPGRSAGQLLREARLARGLHVEALASQLKVAPARIEDLEADRFDEAQGAAYTRALALAVCRALRADPEPVLRALPAATAPALADVDSGLNAPFRNGRGGLLSVDWTWAGKPVVWAPLAFAVAAAVVWWWPTAEDEIAAGRAVRIVDAGRAIGPAPGAAGPPGEAAASAGVGAAPPAVAPVVETVHSAPPGAAASQVDAGRPLVLRADAESWIEVRDALGAVLLSRTLQPGEQVGLAGAMPMQVKIGNAASTTVQVRGQVIDLTGHTRENVARLEVR